MRIDSLLEKIGGERNQYYRSVSEADKGRFYILDKLYQSIQQLENGFEDAELQAILATISNIQITPEVQLGDITNNEYEIPKQLFRIPVFPITFNLERKDEDLLTRVYFEIQACMGHWLCQLPRDIIKNNEDIRAWQRQMILNYRQLQAPRSNFTECPISFMQRTVSNHSRTSFESQIQDYISMSKLPQEAKLPAFHFITRCGGADMKAIVDTILEQQFGGLDAFDTELEHEINWGLSADKIPVCNTALNMNLNLTNEHDDYKLAKKVAHHDPRLIGIGSYIAEHEPDLKIKSKTTLAWQSDVIIPYVNSVAISGQYSDILPLIMATKQ